jgi:hypothetical protein
MAQDLNAMAFPKLSEAQIAQLARYAGATSKRFRAGEALFRAGDREPKFFVIKSGELEIVDVTGDQPKTKGARPGRLYGRCWAFNRQSEGSEWDRAIGLRSV